MEPITKIGNELFVLEMKIFALELEKEIEENLFKYLLQFLDKAKRTQIKRLARWKDKHRALFADLLIRKIIIEKTGFKNEEIKFSVGKYGKPLLKKKSDFFFNLSHSGDWIVCAVDNIPIGIDIERIRSIDYNISKRYFSKEEHNDLMSKVDSDKLFYFFTLWTLKESYVKAVGEGLSIPFRSFTIKVEANNISLRLKGQLQNNKFFALYDINKDYKLAVCAENNDFPECVIKKKVESLTQSCFLV